MLLFQFGMVFCAMACQKSMDRNYSPTLEVCGIGSMYLNTNLQVVLGRAVPDVKVDVELPLQVLYPNLAKLCL